MKSQYTITGRKITAVANKSKRTFTINTDSETYRTIRMSKEEFQSCLNNTANDWCIFLKGNDYYKVN